jgi:hypothetical protein
MQKVKCIDHKINYFMVQEERSLMKTIQQRQTNWVGDVLRSYSLMGREKLRESGWQEDQEHRYWTG